ncbi:hypothetical protein K5F93_26625 [Pseudomonas protegens]|uniref:Vgb family protein n=1 Tax=Pseudomonas protegens TaxID=380021 RepID=UPI001C8D2CDE|nr:hypothetical protein [Pseudomonas protegens]QZI69895.1 hypothetical protein K5F93_26625 [Pseudomonas protegens]
MSTYKNPVFALAFSIPLLIAAGYSLSLFSFNNEASVATGFNIDGAGINNQVKLSKYDSTQASKDKIILNSWVSLAQIDTNTIAVANYDSIILLDKTKKTLCKVTPNWGTTKPEDTTWVPTGIYYTNDTLYIANYRGNNILTGKLNVKDCQLTIESSIKDKSGLGPENLYVDKTGNIYTANYDSGTVVAFNKSGEKIWSAPVPEAHGITADDNYVYTTSLTERNIQKLRKDTGKVELAQGKTGWNIKNSEYLWPTSINIDGNGNLLVSDAQSGMIGLLEPKTLTPVSSFGGMGPGLNHFNYPYTASVNSLDEVLVTSTMRASIYIYDSKTLKLKEIFLPDSQNWDTSEKYENTKLGTGWTNYLDTSAKPQTIFGKSVIPGFGMFYKPDASAGVFKVPDVDELAWKGKPYLYFLQTKKIGEDVLIFSSSSSVALLYAKYKSNYLLLPITLPSQDNWLVDGEIVSNGKALALKIISTAKDEFTKRLETLKKHKTLTPDDVAWLYGESNSSALDSSFKSPAGKNFYIFWKYCSADKTCSKPELQKMAFDFFSETDSNRGTSLGEAALVALISETLWKGELTSSTNTKLSSCGAGKYYKNHEPETIKPDDLSHYISADDIGGSELCISGNKSTTNTKLKIYWLNQDEVPDLVTLSAIDGKKKLTSVTYKIDRNTLDTDPSLGTPYSILRLPNSKTSDYLLKIDKGGVQNRLLIRNIKLLSGKDVAISLIKTEDLKHYGTPNLPKSAIVAYESLLGISPDKDDVFHCGHFATRYIYENIKNNEWRMYDLQSGEAIHTIIEIKTDSGWTIKDPTLGYEIPCSFADIKNGSCLPNYSSIPSAKKWDSRFNNYSPEALIPEAEILAINWGKGRVRVGAIRRD